MGCVLRSENVRPHAVCVLFVVLLITQGPDSLNGISTIRFETIPDGIPPSNIQSKLNNTSESNVPPVTCIVSDYITSFTLKAAQELHIPNVLLWTTSACGFMGYKQFQNLKEQGL
ncbi:hypothetical protein Patl1_03838 [Pistacia atlantica]|uniref:Uncharacterized protein n=1 Tax=Pistacia atlantica TaxID=434234 RepID=A0ACC1BUE0_9ROSI|nr:hypothetical protein Patl1_03838 [Pistacia atlantica]